MRRNSRVRHAVALAVVLCAVAARAAEPAGAQAAPVLETLWQAMADEAPVTGYQAAWAFAAHGDAAVAFARERLVLATLDTTQIEAAITGLEGGTYAQRQAAFDTLASLGVLAEPALRAAMERELPPEPRLQVQALLERIEQPALTAGDRQAIRLVAALAIIDTDAAQSLLREMAERSAPACTEARAALDVAPPLAADSAVVYRVFTWAVILLEYAPVERLLVLGRPCPVQGEGYVAVRCDGDSLLALLRPHLDSPECLLTGSGWIRTSGGREWDFGSNVTRPVRPDGQRVAACIALAEGAGQLDVDASGAARVHLDAERLECRFDVTGPLRMETEHRLRVDADLAPGDAMCLVRDTQTRGPYRMHHVFVVQVLAVPSAVATAFDEATSAVSVRRWIATGQARLCQFIREGQAWNRAAAAMIHEPDDRWARILPGGTRVSVVAVRRPDVHPFRWWDGAGRPVARDRFRQPSEPVPDTLEVWYEVCEPAYSLGQRACGTSVGNPVVTVGAGDGPWQRAGLLVPKEVLEIGGRRCELRQVQARWPRSEGRPGALDAELITTSDADLEVTIGVVTQDGELVAAPSAGPHGERWEGERETRIMNTLPVALDEVKEFVLLTRPRRWVTIEGIATEPSELPPGISGGQ